MTLLRFASASRLANRGLTFRLLVILRYFSVAAAIAISQTLHQLSVDWPNRAIMSALNTLSPIGLSSRLFSGRQWALFDSSYASRLAFRSRVLPKPFVAVTINFWSRPWARKSSIHGVRCNSFASKSSTTWISSASTVQALMPSLCATAVHEVLQHLVLWEESYAPPERTLREKRLPSIHLQPQPKA